MVKDINSLVEDVKINNFITLEDIPDIDLYMDQVIQLFENKLGYLKRNEEDKILTKTMINNYSKGNLFMDIKNKKYSKNHIILIILIYELKSVISIPDIKVAFNNIVKSYDENSADKIDLENLYKKHLKMISKNDDDIKEEILNITKELENLNAEEEKLLLLTYLAAKANMYKRLCEKIVDDLF
ncbi:DUF1836 domain-containing protein [Sarcina sp. JB2]|uniref:DUF1836 domain-containing protein n=1 Tax=Candidatus Sarcina troglodytae TaxID=2726954 RepID=A0ACD1BGJ1_9CLOT|nr:MULTISPECIES: DUF1836 domain-containing protein [Sarcina]MBU5322287.1 DUF1836 domain-containing protein [Sarcina ventriculi]MDO4402724.1 DUF1836 domain-containing protein [Clostridiaceae bacterium]QPJ86509.1 DUF1836 domain-containing protein [Sarcina sp. JB2]